MANSYTQGAGDRLQPGDIAYEMDKTLAKEILSTRKGAEQNMNPDCAFMFVMTAQKEHFCIISCYLGCILIKSRLPVILQRSVQTGQEFVLPI